MKIVSKIVNWCARHPYWVILAVTLIVYGMSLPYPFVWDDEEQIVNNPAVQNLGAIPAIFMGSTFASHGAAGLGGHYFKPMMPLSFNLLWHLGWGQAWIFHLFQIVVHAVNGMLLWRLMYGLVPRHPGKAQRSDDLIRDPVRVSKAERKRQRKSSAQMRGIPDQVRDDRFPQDDMLVRLILLLSSLLFIIHPLQVEAVVYIAALQEPLFALFGLLALNVVVYPWRRMHKWKEWQYLSLVTGLLLLSMLSKETGGLFVVVGLGLYVWVHRKPSSLFHPVSLCHSELDSGSRSGVLAQLKQSNKQILNQVQDDKFRSTEPLTDNQLVNRLFGITLSLGAVYATMRFLIARVPLSSDGPSPIMVADVATRLQTMPAVMWFYFQKLVWPDRLFIAQHWLVEDISVSNFGIPLVGLVTIFSLSSVILILGITRARHSDLSAEWEDKATTSEESRSAFKDPSIPQDDVLRMLLPLYATGYAIIWLNVVFHSQLFPLDLTVAERWGYMWLMGVSMWVACGLVWTRSKLSNKCHPELVSGSSQELQTKSVFKRQMILKQVQDDSTWGAVTISVVLILLILTTRTFLRIPTWSSELRLYEHDVAVNPGAYDLQNNYGVALYRVGRGSESREHFEISTQLAPHWWTNWNNLGAMEEADGDYDLALEHYLRSIENGDYFLAYENYPGLLVKLERYDEAETFLREEALPRFPYNVKLRQMWAWVDAEKDD